MKRKILISVLAITLTTILSCKKEGCTDKLANNYDSAAKKNNGTCTYDPELLIPTVKISDIYFVSDSNASVECYIQNDGGDPIQSYGVCWSINPSPTYDNDKTELTSDVVDYYYVFVNNLTQNTTYYLRAYAKNSVGVGYGEELTITTNELSAPIIKTKNVYSGNLSSVYTGGIIVSNGNSPIIKYGVCWSNQQNPTIVYPSNDYDGNTNSFNSQITGLNAETVYYIRAYAINAVDTSYGQQEIYQTHSSSVGDLYQGGIVFYTQNGGYHGLICALEDQSVSASWGCQQGTGAIGLLLNSGEENTEKIINICNTPGIAAVLCTDYFTTGGYTDWFLPSKQEMEYLYNVLPTINSSITTAFGVSISANNYWTSSEINSDNANVINMSDGTTSSGIKSGNYYVRAIRAF